ncbi:MAG: ABC transporter ATP-binding protein [Alphaproteobacteria bacterium]
MAEVEIPRTLGGVARSLAMRPRVVWIAVGLQGLSTLMELLGLFILVPIFQYVQANGDLAALSAQHAPWRMLIAAYGFVGLKVGLGTLLATSMVALLLRQGFGYGRHLFEVLMRERAVARMRQAMFKRFLHADTKTQDGTAAGAVVSDMTSEMQRAVEYLFAQVGLRRQIALGVIYVAGLFVVSVMMTTAALVVFGLAFLLLRSLARGIERVSAASTRANRDMSGFLVERLKQARLVRLAGTEEAEVRQMTRLTDDQRRANEGVYARLGLVEMATEPLIVGGGFALIYVGLTEFGLGIETVGVLLVMMVRLMPIAKQFALTRQSIRVFRPGYAAVLSRMAALEAAREPQGSGRRLDAVREGIRFENVAFDYHGAAGVPALDGVSVEFAAGRMTALVGPSGAGKSTLIDMLPMLRRPASGRITIDGVPLDAFDLTSLRAAIAYAPQSPQIFDVSAAEHIGYGKPGATRAEIERAAALAGADEFIRRLPQGFDTNCGTAGHRLSGGQRQRLDLARAIVRAAPILLLDEPSSQLDADSENHLRMALARIRSETNTTMIVIAHRLSTVAIADHIVVMSGGRVAHQGRHADLLAAGGWYADAYRLQSDHGPRIGAAA